MTPLSYALLGLVRMQPRSGYALRKVFETTPLGGYSSSPGSIYPALKSLEKAGLLETQGPASHGKGLYHLTPQGERALETWLAAPIGDLGEAMLRFAFLPDEDGQAIHAFLDSFEQAAEAQADALRAFMDGGGAEGAGGGGSRSWVSAVTCCCKAARWADKVASVSGSVSQATGSASSAVGPC